MRLFLVSLLCLGLVGCAYSIKDITVSHKDPKYVRQCAAQYSEAISGGNQIGSKMETLRAAREAYEVCIEASPDKGEESTGLYAELTRLDDLLKRKILTQEEFNAQKKLLLEKYK